MIHLQYVPTTVLYLLHQLLHLGDGVRIAVADLGPGLSDEDQRRIFERFYRADSSRVRIDGEGSGLGLSIVDAVMKAHGGDVSVASELGKGSTFTLFFPHSADALTE